MDVVLLAIGVLWVAWIVGVLPAIRVHRARIRVHEWASRQGLELLDCRFSLWESNWRVPFRVTVRDRTGHEISGVARVPGFLRRDVTVDWGGGGGGQR
jgi:hypothetical protein